MYFNKIAHPSNFVFARQAEPHTGALVLPGRNAFLTRCTLGGDVHRLSVDDGRWADHGSTAELSTQIEGETLHRLELSSDGTLVLQPEGHSAPLLLGMPGASFGVCGQSWMFQFQHTPELQFYGLGEHSQGLEKSGQRVKFWNTDLMGDFHLEQIREGFANPMYVDVPWLIVKQGNCYVGILVNNPGAVFMDLASNFVWSEKNTEDRDRRSFYLGAPSGKPELYIIAGPDLASLLRKFQQLVGRTPLPPLWALGHHQCRWGYGSPDDLLALDESYRKHGIPCDGLWLDIDYMDAYRVFTFSPSLWGNEEKTRQSFAKLSALGRRVIPILDPGVKVDAAYEVCQDGLSKHVFCVTPEGLPFTGFVWPGKTYMPDFSLAQTRAWWADRVARFAALGVSGAWLDMNDPSVGAVELNEMLFDHGRQPHTYYHNQYALGMAKASREGFLAAQPERRPFLLSRSAYTSCSRYTAVWTGDNASNWHHLRQSIPISLGLAMSGIPFNGPDAAGFMDDTSPALAIAWYKACFLFPFLRNHSSAGTRHQEPWALGVTTCRILTRYIRLRYKLLPYLYQLFIAQEERGEAILRPLFHDFEDSAALPLGTINDQFLIGPSILQAPVLEEDVSKRPLLLPGDSRWYSASEGRWLASGRTVAEAGGAVTPLFIREGEIVPMQSGERSDNRNDLSELELHCFLRLDSTESAVLRYAFDDGETFAYKTGARSSFIIEAWSLPDGGLSIRLREVVSACGSARVRLIVYDKFKYIRVTEGTRTRRLSVESFDWVFTGRRLRAVAGPWMRVGTGSSATAEESE